MPEKHGRNNSRYRRFRAIKRRTENPWCHICRKPIDLSLPDTDPLGWTWDHDIPLALGGSLFGPGRPAHRECNTSRGDGSKQSHLAATVALTTTEKW